MITLGKFLKNFLQQRKFFVVSYSYSVLNVHKVSKKRPAAAFHSEEMQKTIL